MFLVHVSNAIYHIKYVFTLLYKVFLLFVVMSYFSCHQNYTHFILNSQEFLKVIVGQTIFFGDSYTHKHTIYTRAQKPWGHYLQERKTE